MPSATQSRLLSPWDKELIRLYSEGLPLAEIAAKLDDGGPSMSANQISAAVSRLRDAGFDLPPRRGRAKTAKGGGDYSHKDNDTIARMYGEGATNKAIADALGRAYGAVSMQISKLKREGRIPQQRPSPSAATAPTGAPITPAAAEAPTLPAPRRAAISPPALSDDRLAALLLHVDGSRPDAGQQPLSAREAAVLVARPDLVRRDGERYRLTAEGRRWARAHDTRPDTNPPANSLYRLLYKIAGLDDVSALDAARRGGLDASASRVYGWRKHPTDRKHVAMMLDELEAIMEGILDMDAAQDRKEGNPS